MCSWSEIIATTEMLTRSGFGEKLEHYVRLTFDVRWRKFLYTLLLFFLPVCSAQDNRCYLSGSGSTVNFFVPENITVDSVLGSLPVLGDASSDILLTLDRGDYPVQIIPGTKNISLTRQLDREGKDGPSSVAVNVICDRRGSTDPSIVIPLNIRVQDINDNAPKFIGDPYTLNISEVTVPGTVVLQGIKASDIDQQGAFSTVHYSIKDSVYANYIDFANGLDGTLRLKRQLDYETVQQFQLTLRAEDLGDPPLFSETFLTVNVIDADDQNPRFHADKYNILLPFFPVMGEKLNVIPGPISAYDQDLGINASVHYSFTSDGADNQYLDIDPFSGVVIVREDIPRDQINQPITIVVKAVQVDNPDRYALTTLTVSREAVLSDRLQFVQENYVTSVLENRPVDSVLLTLVTNRPGDRRLHFIQDDELETFRVSESGELVLVASLDYETRDRYNFTVTASNGQQSDRTVVTVIVLNVNDWDPRFRYPSFNFVAPARLKKGSVMGRLTVYDGDRGDRISVGLMGPDSRAFSVTTDGDLVLNDLDRLNSSVAHLVAVARDSGVPPRRSSVPITVKFPQQLLSASTAQAESSALLMIILGSMLGALLLVILTLGIYIKKHKKDRIASSQHPAMLSKPCGYAGSDLSHVQLNPPGGESVITTSAQSADLLMAADAHRTDGPRNPLANGCSLGSQTSLNRSLVSSARSSRMSASKQQGSSSANTQRPLTQNNTYSENPGIQPSPNRQNGVISPVWPEGSVPKRVKKLSWEDEQNRMELDPDVSVTPLPSIVSSVDMTSTPIYF